MTINIQGAVKQYLDEAGTQLGKIRAEKSKSLRRCSAQTYNELKELYSDRLLKLDDDLMVLIKDPDQHHIGRPNWQMFNEDAVFILSKEVDDIFHNLAAEFGLTGQSLTFLDNATPATSST